MKTKAFLFVSLPALTLNANDVNEINNNNNASVVNANKEVTKPRGRAKREQQKCTPALKVLNNNVRATAFTLIVKRQKHYL